jgi:hypothetical protein
MYDAYMIKKDAVELYCENCHHKLFGRSLDGHNHRPSNMPYFSGPDDKFGTYYMGIEIETELRMETQTTSRMRRSMATASQVKSNLFFYKRDGSLDESGVEIVSFPFTYSFLKQRGWREVSRVAESFVKSGFTSFASGKCGIHVHVSKHAIKNVEGLKLFFYENQIKIKKIAQRRQDNNRYCQYEPGGDKYRAINTSPNETVEFRIFRGNLRPSRILKNIEFVAAVIEFWNTKTKAKVDFSDFASFVTANKVKYPYLEAYISNMDNEDKGNEDANVRDSVLAEIHEFNRGNVRPVLDEEQRRGRLPISERRKSYMQKALLHARSNEGILSKG